MDVASASCFLADVVTYFSTKDCAGANLKGCKSQQILKEGVYNSFKTA